jgi:hypothetical protein
MYEDAKRRARDSGLEFAITRLDIQIPVVCPVLGIPLIRKQGHPVDGSPSLDRVDNSRGYVRGNVAVISMLANRIKNNSTAAQLRAVLVYMETFNANT